MQRERQFDQGDIWRVFCAADPERALRGLLLAAEADRWEASAWRDLIWAATEKGDDGLQFELAGLLVGMPESILTDILPATCSWLQKRRKILANAPQDRISFLTIWDRLADLVYPTDALAADDDEGRLVERALNEPAGVLAWSFLDYIAEGRPAAGSGLTLEQSNRLTRAVCATGRPGLLARVILCRSLAYLESIDPDWASSHLMPFLEWEQPHATAMWHSRAFDHTGTARLFNAVKTRLLQTFEQPGMSDNDLEGLMAQLLTIALWHRRQEANDYILSGAEIKKALASGTDGLRANAAWQLWRIMGDASDQFLR